MNLKDKTVTRTPLKVKRGDLCALGINTDHSGDLCQHERTVFGADNLSPSGAGEEKAFKGPGQTLFCSGPSSIVGRVKELSFTQINMRRM